MEKLVTLNISGEFDKGFVVQAEVRQDGGTTKNQVSLAIAGASGKLPANPELLEQYRHWQSLYNNLEVFFPNRLKKKSNFTNASKDEAFEACRKAAKLLAKTLNSWLQSPDFQPIVNLLQNHLQDSTSTRILLATENHWLRRLPWCEWNLLDHIPNPEVVLASPKFKQVKGSGNAGKKEKVKILVILGDNAGTDADQAVIQQLIPDAEICWLKEPQRRDLDAPLWEKQWDILFFAGHGKTENDGSIGKIQINSQDTLTIDEIKNHLKKAINNGLKLAIFNACDGLGIAYQLAEGEDLYLPQIIVMREILPIAIAPKFLEHFLKAYTQGLSLSTAIRDSRKELQIEEKDFPCASWLPVLCQNPAEIPLRWHDLVIPPNPYQGLSAFQEKDAALFFGRSTFTNQLVKVVETKKLVAVIGASGSGKSSVVLAGLIPSLRQQENWLIASLRPESTPFDNLAKALLSPVTQLETGKSEGVAEINADEINQLATDLQEGNRTLSDVVKSIGSSRRFLLVIDQFEEIYTYPNQKSRQFLDCLLDAVQNFSAFRLVITLRVDFLNQAIEYNPFREQLDRWKPEFIGGMARTELQAAIEEPAKKRNVYLEAGLTEHILNEVGEEQGNLPLLEFALTELWKQQENGLLNRLKYDEIGGVEKALCRHAEGVYDALKEGDKERTKQIFMKLVSPGEGTEYTRQLATRAEVGEENWDLVTHLATARLVVSNRNETTQIETVEIVHEALIKAWPDLRKWIEENDTFLRWKKRLKVAFLEWERNENKEGYLLQGAPLGEAEGYLLQRLEEISKAEREFINLSLEQEKARQQRELEQERKARKAAQARNRTLVISLGVLSVLSAFIWIQRTETERQKVEAQARVFSLSSKALFNSDKKFDALIEGVRAGVLLKQETKAKTDTKIEVVTALLKAFHGVKEYNRLEGHSDDVRSISYSPDGQLMASASADKTIKIWRSDGTLLKTLQGHNDVVNSVSFSPDGQLMASASDDGTVKIWDVSGKNIRTIDHNQEIIAEKISTNGVNMRFESAEEIGRKIAPNAVKSAVFSPDGRMIATASTLHYKFGTMFNFSQKRYNAVKLWNINGNLIKVLQGYSRNNNSIKFSPDATLIAVASDDVIELWNIEGIRFDNIYHFERMEGHQKIILDVSFSPDGKTLASASQDDTLKLWSIKNKRYTANKYEGYEDFGSRLNFTSNGLLQVDGKTWNHKGVLLNNFKGYLSYDGQKSATIEDSNTVRIWANDGTLLATLVGHKDVIRFAIFSPDSKTILSASQDRTVKLWKVDGTLINTWKYDIYGEKNVNFSPNSRLFSLHIDGGSCNVIKITGQLIRSLSNCSVSFSPDSQKVAYITGNTAKLSSLDGHEIISLKHNERINYVSFSPDGQLVATASDDTTIKLWTLEGKLYRIIEGHKGPVQDVSFSPDSQIVASASSDLTMKLWNRDGSLLESFEIAPYGSVKFSPDGKTLAVSGSMNTLQLWNLDFDDMLGRSCEWLHEYMNNPNVNEKDRALCNGIVTGK